MQNKGVIRLFAILLAIVCLYQLSFTFVANRVEKKAAEVARGNELKEVHYLDSMSSEVVYNLGIRKYTYKEVQQREIQLGLDLRKAAAAAGRCVDQQAGGQDDQANGHGNQQLQE